MTYKKLRGRLIDICNGAGYRWLEDDEYFEADDGTLQATGKVIVAIERAFNLPDDSRIRLPWYLQNYDDPDSLTEMVQEAIEFDTKKT